MTDHVERRIAKSAGHDERIHNEDASSNRAAEGFGPRNVSEAVDDFTGRAIPNSAAETHSGMPDIYVRPGDPRKPAHATPNRVHTQDWRDGYDTGFAEGASGRFNPDGSYKDA